MIDAKIRFLLDGMTFSVPAYDSFFTMIFQLSLGRLINRKLDDQTQ